MSMNHPVSVQSPGIQLLPLCCSFRPGCSDEGLTTGEECSREGAADPRKVYLFARENEVEDRRIENI